jgi:putative component of membrane protein insertase Oxa1/YidC/SpoIIIJ protein YidD
LAFIARACIALLEGASHVPVPDALDTHAATAANLALRLYRRLLSRHAGRRCLFRVSCSEHAAGAFAACGWRQGLQASLVRVRRCGGAYSLASDIHGRLTLVANDGTEFSDDELAGWISDARLGGRPIGWD